MITSTAVGLWIGAAGYCTHPEFLTLRGGSFRAISFPAGFACIHHPEHGYILFDTGYSSRFFEETATLPQSLYRYITPVIYQQEDSVMSQLAQQGIRADQITYVILSHFHGDHIGGARDFPQATFIYLSESYQAVKDLSSLRAVKAGFLVGLLPDDLTNRSRVFNRSDAVPLTSLLDHDQQDDAMFKHKQTLAVHTNNQELPWKQGYDLLGDGSLIAIELSGHAEGMIGLLLSTATDDYLLCADTVWSSTAFTQNRPPHFLAGMIMSDRQQYKLNLHKLRQFHLSYPSMRIVPSHCKQALQQWGGRWW